MRSPARALAAVVGAVAALWVACEDPCKSCPGCCDEGSCLPGTATGACGVGGAACVACGQARSCRAGTCVDAPDAGPRDGGVPVLCQCVAGCCRADGGCAPGNLPDQCGASRRFCTVCAAGEFCPSGTCMPTGGCAGCLDALGICRPGNTASACGRGGAPCVACVGSDVCDSRGACFGNSTCNATNCPAGCCASANVCVPPSATQCGVLGSACVACPDGGTCDGGVCQ